MLLQIKKKLLVVSCGLLAVGCTGYTPLYQGNPDVTIGKIQMEQVEKNVGERRVAQKVSQRLRRAFPSSQGKYNVIVNIKEDTSTLAVRRDATVERSQINLVANVNIYEDGKADPIATKSLSATSAYSVESTPYSTDAGRVFARQKAAETLANEIVRVIWIEMRNKQAGQ